MEHSRLSPSSASRWVNCPGSTFAPNADTPPNAAATFGTLVHSVASGDAEIPDNLSPEELADLCLCLNVFRARVPENAIIEERIVSERIPEFGGTIDAYTIDENTIEVYDLKTGLLGVSAKSNLQLLCYLCLLDEKYPGKSRFAGTIIQPRLRYTERVEYGPDDIDATWARIQRVATEQFRAAGRWCNYCPLIAHCHEVIKYGQSFDLNKPKPTLEDFVKILDFEDSYGKLVEAAKEKVLGVIEAGGFVPGYKAAFGRGRREWSDEQKAIEFFGREFKGKSLFSPEEFRSVAQVEGIVGKIPDELVNKIPGPVVLKHESSISRTVEFGSEFNDG